MVKLKKTGKKKKLRCEHCQDGGRVPEKIRFLFNERAGELTIVCGECLEWLSDDIARNLDGITLRSSVMAERANAKK